MSIREIDHVVKELLSVGYLLTDLLCRLALLPWRIGELLIYER